MQFPEDFAIECDAITALSHFRKILMKTQNIDTGCQTDSPWTANYYNYPNPVYYTLKDGEATEAAFNAIEKVDNGATVTCNNHISKIFVQEEETVIILGSTEFSNDAEKKSIVIETAYLGTSKGYKLNDALKFGVMVANSNNKLGVLPMEGFSRKTCDKPTLIPNTVSKDEQDQLIQENFFFEYSNVENKEGYLLGGEPVPFGGNIDASCELSFNFAQL